MRFIQYKTKSDNVIHFGLISEDEGSIAEIQFPHIKNILDVIKLGDSGVQAVKEKLKDLKWNAISSDIEFLPPITNPEKIICLALNYRDHCAEADLPVPKELLIFNKFNKTLVGHNGNVIQQKSSPVG